MLGVLLFPNFYEVEAALALEAARGLGLPRATLAKGRRALLGRAGAVWTPTYAFPARPSLRALVLPGAEGVERWGKDPVYLAFLEEVWGDLEAVFVGENAHLFLSEAGRLPDRIAASKEVATLLRVQGYRVEEAPWHREGRVWTTRGGMDLWVALWDWGRNVIEGRV